MADQKFDDLNNSDATFRLDGGVPVAEPRCCTGTVVGRHRCCHTDHSSAGGEISIRLQTVTCYKP